MKLKQGIVFLVAALMVSGSFAGTIATPHIAGDMNGWDHSGVMTETALGSDIWEISYTDLTPNTRLGFKVTDGTWDNSVPGPNSWLYTDGAGAITITYDGNTYADGWSPNIDRIGLSTDGNGGGWTVAGDFQGWNNANPATAMTPMGGGIYTFATVLVPGTYYGKAVVSGTWDSISWDGRSENTANNEFTTDAVNDTVVFTVDSYAGISKVQVIPEPTSMALIVVGTLGAVISRRLRN